MPYSKPSSPAPAAPIALVLLALSPWAATAAERVACRVDYGGETRVVTAEPVDSPYWVPTVAFGSYLLFRPVFERGSAIKLYSYVDRKSGPALIHQAVYPYPPVSAPVYGFTGLQLVYEPARDSELQYWCALETTP
jgi:hypothetical protein